jgi:hypothetical protein
MVEATCEAGVEVRAQWVPGDTREIERADMWYRGDYAWDFALDRGRQRGVSHWGLFGGDTGEVPSEEKVFYKIPCCRGYGG